MNKHIKYLKYIIRHKFWVAYYCFKEGLILRGLLHDLSKFLPGEWFPYVNYFYGKPDEEKFNIAWLRHQRCCNKHHWQWWILMQDEGITIVIKMPKRYALEMICDWRGAGRAQGHGDDIKEWYDKNKDKMKLHPETRSFVEKKLKSL